MMAIVIIIQFVVHYVCRVDRALEQSVQQVSTLLVAQAVMVTRLCMYVNCHFIRFLSYTNVTTSRLDTSTQLAVIGELHR